jgi:hypothetical protein
MALPVIADTFRISLPWQDLGSTVGIRPVNVLHVHSATGTTSAVSSAVELALSSHGVAMFDTLYTGLTLPTIEVLPLDGTSATHDQAVTTPPHGGGSGGVLPQVATVVSLHTPQRGSQGRGRVYVGPMGETQVSNGLVASASITTMLAGWAAFISDLAGGSPPAELVVASYKHATQHPVTSHRIDTVCGTQRRRQNQLR